VRQHHQSCARQLDTGARHNGSQPAATCTMPRPCAGMAAAAHQWMEDPLLVPSPLVTGMRLLYTTTIRSPT
jgi:hypothetical protein